MQDLDMTHQLCDRGLLRMWDDGGSFTVCLANPQVYYYLYVAAVDPLPPTNLVALKCPTGVLADRAEYVVGRLLALRFVVWCPELFPSRVDETRQYATMSIGNGKRLPIGLSCAVPGPETPVDAKPFRYFGKEHDTDSRNPDHIGADFIAFAPISGSDKVHALRVHLKLGKSRVVRNKVDHVTFDSFEVIGKKTQDRNGSVQGEVAVRGRSHQPVDYDSLVSLR
eukprot:TRINITY_DN25333_c0_g1_i1.p1 TRINITY_DN25333_c0_g1~~TRINITY_DN25333_c0_g1_i1.p1  ORF type:complete len:224 (-),score=12.51 TRINITY_DN25333_c0_g1_i1:223-894(-)